MNCKKCGYECNDDDKFCKNCGEKLDVLKLCNNCQKRCKPEAKYCPYCGEEFNPSESDNQTKQKAKRLKIYHRLQQPKAQQLPIPPIWLNVRIVIQIYQDIQKNVQNVANG